VRPWLWALLDGRDGRLAGLSCLRQELRACERGSWWGDQPMRLATATDYTVVDTVSGAGFSPCGAGDPPGSAGHESGQQEWGDRLASVAGLDPWRRAPDRRADAKALLG